MKKFYREYKLLKDIPEMKAGETVKWDCWKERFTDIGDYIGLSKPEPKVSYTLEFIEERPEWFEGVGEQREYYPKFPSFKDFYAEDNGCGYYVADLEFRHNDMCRTCQLLHKVNYEEVKEAVYSIVKTKYEEKFLSNNSNPGTE